MNVTFIFTPPAGTSCHTSADVLSITWVIGMHGSNLSHLPGCAESEKILAQDGPAAEKLKLPDIFGATEDDTSSLRIVSLYEVSPAPLFCSCQAMP